VGSVVLVLSDFSGLAVRCRVPGCERDHSLTADRSTDPRRPPPPGAWADGRDEILDRPTVWSAGPSLVLVAVEASKAARTSETMINHTAIELHDSKVQQQETIGSDIIVILSAYVHRSDGRPGMDAGTGWIQAAIIRIEKGQGHVACPMEIIDGSIFTGNKTYVNLLEIPLNAPGPSRIELRGNHGEFVQITGEAISIELTGEATFVETNKSFQAVGPGRQAHEDQHLNLEADNEIALAAESEG